jgi:hypothetical protein
MGDISGNGKLDADDVRLIQLKVLRRTVPEIPDLPRLVGVNYPDRPHCRG